MRCCIYINETFMNRESMYALYILYADTYLLKYI